MNGKKIVKVLSLSLLVVLVFSFNASGGNITYSLSKASNPTSDQSDAYSKITVAMDSAVNYYNTYSSVTKKLTIQYEPTVSTADGNSNGNIRFGKNRSYMVVCTAMHEIAHVLGIGTTNAYKRLIVGGVYTGINATEKLKEVNGDPTAVLKGDAVHFWPYGLNYSSEVKSDLDLINHVKIVDAMQQDFFPRATALMSSETGRSHFSRQTGKVINPCQVAGKKYTISGREITTIDQYAITNQMSIRIINNPKSIIVIH